MAQFILREKVFLSPLLIIISNSLTIVIRILTIKLPAVDYKDLALKNGKFPFRFIFAVLFLSSKFSRTSIFKSPQSNRFFGGVSNSKLFMVNVAQR